MGINSFASRVTSSQFPAGSLTLTVAGGEPIQVFGIHFTAPAAAGGAAIFLINNAAGTLIQTVNVAALGHADYEVPFMADAGLQIVSNVAGAEVAVFHNSPGN